VKGHSRRKRIKRSSTSKGIDGVPRFSSISLRRKRAIKEGREQEACCLNGNSEKRDAQKEAAGGVKGGEKNKTGTFGGLGQLSGTTPRMAISQLFHETAKFPEWEKKENRMARLDPLLVKKEAGTFDRR